MEIWKDVIGFEGYYQVSDLGRVKSLSRKSIRRGRVYPQKERIMRQSGHYKSVTLQKYGISKRYSVHRLVAIAFIPNPENKPEVNHKFGIKTDNRASELEWMTKQENEEHSIKNRLKYIPSNAKINFNQADEIRTMASHGHLQKDLAIKFGLHPTTISKIVSGSSW